MPFGRHGLDRRVPQHRCNAGAIVEGAVRPASRIALRLYLRSHGMDIRDTSHFVASRMDGARPLARRLPVSDEVRALLDVLAIEIAQPLDDVLRAGRGRVLAGAVDDGALARPVALGQTWDGGHDGGVQAPHLVEGLRPLAGLEPGLCLLAGGLGVSGPVLRAELRKAAGDDAIHDA